MAVLLHIVRALGVLVAALGAALMVCWTWFPGVLDRYHAESLQAYRGQYDAVRSDIRDLAAASPDGSLVEALRKSRALLEEVEPYQPLQLSR